MYNKYKYKKTIIMTAILMSFSNFVFAQEAPVVGQSGNPFAKSAPPAPNKNNNQPANQPLTPEQEEAVRQIVLNLSPSLMTQQPNESIVQEIKDPYTLYLEKNETIRGTLNGKYMIFNSFTNDYRYEIISRYRSVSIFQNEAIEEEENNLGKEIKQLQNKKSK